MGLSKNILDRSDITTYPIKLRYQSSYTSTTAPSNGITITRGTNASYSTATSESVNYALVRQLYYQEYLTGSLLDSANYWNTTPQSTAASGSLDDDYRYFPSASNSKVTIIAIPPNIFGENIARNSFVFAGSGINLIDDGNGNVINTSASNVHVGNILYSQGVIVITNQSYANSIISAGGSIQPYTMTLTSEITIYQNEVRCKVGENQFNYTNNPSAVKINTSGSYIDAVTGSEFRPYATMVGLYNDQDELLVVGKLSRAYPIPPNTDMTFNIRWDS